jgi:diaminohydroxyphosphoribosylaminopyrimidine deaminase/5-amino-6-(5-phosphoribosylamino)uracil reductase
MPEKDDIKFMQRCLDLASKSEGRTYPNPLVGSVIVHNGRIIGEGYHLKAGEPHAEVVAINSVNERELLGSSTLYVNLEPCSHFGKTPPCSDLIISCSIKRVVAGTTDTSEKVSGKGIAKLKESGCEVITGVLEEKCRWINRRFFTFHEKKRPYIVLKWAQSADGFLDAERSKDNIRKPLWITGNTERVLVHRWRASEQSILAGAGTIRIDNPKLNVRDWTGKDPVRLILSSSGNLDSSSALFKARGRNIMFTHNAIAKFGETIMVILDEGADSASQISDYLYMAGIQSVLIEGGAKVLEHFISSGLWDEARIFSGRDYFKKGVRAPSIRGRSFSHVLFSRSSMEVILNDLNQHSGLVDY